MVSEVRYIVHEGPVVSVNDGQRHYIGLMQLVQLYRLPHGTWRSARNTIIRPDADVVHLYPQEHAADYERIAAELEAER